MSSTNEIWVIDTSSIIEIRRNFQKNDQRKIYNNLTTLVKNDQLVFPIELYNELERATNKNKIDHDLPFNWAKKNKRNATRFGVQYETLSEILSHPQVRNVVDNDKVGVEEADPHVLALAAYLKNDGFEVTVIAEETKDRPDKLSISSACGILKLYRIPIGPFIIDKKLITQVK